MTLRFVRTPLIVSPCSRWRSRRRRERCVDRARADRGRRRGHDAYAGDGSEPAAGNAARALVPLGARRHRRTCRRCGNNITALAQIFIDEGRVEGVRGDIAFVQSILETGWFSFAGSQIPPDANNFAGINAFNDRAGLPNCKTR